MVSIPLCHADKAHGRRRRLRPTRLLLPLLVCDFGLWSLLPLSSMRLLVPSAGAVALILAGLSLGRVVLRIHRMARGSTVADDALMALRKAGIQMALVLLSMLLVTGAYWMTSARVLAVDRRAEVMALLWALPMGGLVLSVCFGELVSRALDVIELERADRPCSGG